MSNDPHDSQRENELIIDRRIPIDVYKKKNEVRKKAYSRVLNEGKQKSEHKALYWSYSATVE